MAEDTSLERDDEIDEMALDSEEVALVADEDSLIKDDAMDDLALLAEEAAEEIRLVGAGIMVKEWVPLEPEVGALENASEAAELPLTWLDELESVEREKMVLVPMTIGTAVKLGK